MFWCSYDVYTWIKGLLPQILSISQNRLFLALDNEKTEI